MPLFVIACALAMPAIAFLSQRGAFGPDSATISDRYPTLLVAAGYAFAIWSLIFLLDLAFALRQAARSQRGDAALRRLRCPAALGFALTASWMVLFSQQWFWAALAVIWGALAALLVAAQRAAMAPPGSAAASAWARWALGLHAGWLSLAAFLNTAQVVVAYELLSVERMLPWSAALWALAGVLLLAMNRRLGGHLAYALAAVWGLAGVVLAQARNGQAGAGVSAGIALALAAALLAQTAWLRARSASGRTIG